ncbi:DUF1330 domain-containing protein [Rhizobium sp. L1K21]|uniref:DUF1330 domain-containing protein n=1 Tax=Rhizobium sp. L1K21 TaxID=2954933 RepID=UPI002091EF31|nr:DUF1330 domain-containing protein [Rhizobium sp. L1K21]MCO6187261.1 DUF1330 domain-containing protein [Rhizobium sp. L1K21]
MHTSFSRERWDGFRAIDDSGPIHMLNLVRFRQKADYDDGRDVSGAEAYKTYSKLSGPVFSRLGGRIVWRGKPQFMMIGPDGEDWDIAFIAEYPDAAAFAAMIEDPEYRKAMPHRQAGVLDSRLIRMKPLDFGGAF